MRNQKDKFQQFANNPPNKNPDQQPIATKVERPFKS